MKTGLTISAAAHAAVLLWAIVSIGPRLMEATPTESMPIDLVPTSEFTKLTAGSQKGKVEPPKPLAEKVAEQKRVDDPTPKVVPKQEIAPTMPPVPPPAPQPKVVEAKPPEAKPSRSPRSPRPSPPKPSRSRNRRKRRRRRRRPSPIRLPRC